MKSQKTTTKATKKAREVITTLGVSLLFLLAFFVGVYYSLGIFAIVS